MVRADSAQYGEVKIYGRHPGFNWAQGASRRSANRGSRSVSVHFGP